MSDLKVIIEKAEKYFEDGNTQIHQDQSFTSDNTVQLNREEIKELLLKQAYVMEALRSKS